MAQIEVPGYRQVQAVQLYDQSSTPNPIGSAAVANNADAVATTTGLLPAAADEMLYNGASWDRRRANVDTTILTLTALGAAGVNSADQVNYNGRGVQIGISITAFAGTSPTLTVTIQGKDVASGLYYTLLASTAIAGAVTFQLLTIYPGAPTTANVSTPQVLPRTWRVSCAVGGSATPTITGTIGASVIV